MEGGGIPTIGKQPHPTTRVTAEATDIPHSSIKIHKCPQCVPLYTNYFKAYNYLLHSLSLLRSILILTAMVLHLVYVLNRQFCNSI